MKGSGLHMPNIALDAGNPKRNRAPGTAERLHDGVALDGVSDRSSGGVRLEIVELAWRTAGTSHGLANQQDLGMTCWCADVPAGCKSHGAVCRTSRIHRSRLDHPVDPVPIPFGRRQGLDSEDERSLGTHVAIGIGIERVADTVRADHTHEIEATAHPGTAQIGDGANERLITITARERVHRRVQGGQSGRAGGAIRSRRPHEIEVVGDPIGQHGEASARHGILVDSMLRSPVGRRRNLRTDEDSGGAIA